MEPCCEDLNNRMTMQIEDRDDLVVYVCMICHRRHFELTVDAGEYNLKMH